jgi:hypothetical protein
MQHIEDIWSATESLRNENPPCNSVVGKLYILQVTPLEFSAETEFYTYNNLGNKMDRMFIPKGDEVCLVISQTKEFTHVFVEEAIVKLENTGFIGDIKIELIPFKEPCSESSQC